MSQNPVIYALSEGVATLTLNRPEVMNALSSALRTDLLAALMYAAGEARVIVLTGAGRAFCPLPVIAAVNGAAAGAGAGAGLAGGEAGFAGQRG